MLAPAHDIRSTRPSDVTGRRTAIIGSVALLHVAIVYAIVTGMAGAVLTTTPAELITRFIRDPVAPPRNVFVPPRPVFKTVDIPTAPNVPIPVITTAIDQPPRTLGGQTSSTGTPDSAAGVVGGTHTIPPYPDLARLLGHQGTVLLQLTVSPQGNVVSAVVLTSTGYPELDSAAVDWVGAHWKYKPAIQGGQPVTSQVQVSIKFDLRQAAR
jgi:periplasmic protein TonB